MNMYPDRGEFEVLGATVKVTVPLPAPPPDVTVIHS
jgi:hypothetical protein